MEVETQNLLIQCSYGFKKERKKSETQNFGVVGVPLFILLFDWLPVCR